MYTKEILFGVSRWGYEVLFCISFCEMKFCLVYANSQHNVFCISCCKMKFYVPCFARASAQRLDVTGSSLDRRIMSLAWPMRLKTMSAGSSGPLHPAGLGASMSDGFPSDDDDDAIWLHGRHEDVQPALISDLPKLPETLDSALREEKDGMLDANDMFTAVAFWLYSHYGAVALEVVMDVKAEAVEDQEVVNTTSTAVHYANSPSKCEADASPWVASGERRPVPFSPGPSPTKRYRCKDPELLQLVSSGRVHGKQPDTRPATLKRTAKLCQAASCVFSTGQPGQPARAQHSEFCMWCDPEAMKVELASKAGQAKIKKALSLLSTHALAHRAALAKLPDDYSQTLRARLDYCQSPECVFNERRPGHPAWAGTGSLCAWCDTDVLVNKLRTEAGASSIRKQMSLFRALSDDVYRRAMALLPEDYVHTSGHYCQAEGCRFNARRPGLPACCVDAGSYCIWHDDSAMDSALATPAGRGSVRRALANLRQSGVSHEGFSLWERALELLPLDFALSARLCANPACQFSLRHIGQPGRSIRPSGLCSWCDTEVLAHREGSTQGHLDSSGVFWNHLESSGVI